MTVLQLRHENVSNAALCSSDLLLIIASPQSGQCRMGGRSGAGIAQLFSEALSVRLARLQVSPVQRGGKNAESSRHECSDDDLGWHRCAPFVPGA
jgi:hypothetical protein